LSIEQACQTGGPQAACGPIACLWRPAEMFLDLHNAKLITKSVFFDLMKNNGKNMFTTKYNIAYIIICGKIFTNKIDFAARTAV
jgi:hypothetical protein